MNDRELAALDRLVVRRPALSKGEALFRAGQTPRSIFVIRSGALRTYAYNASGDEQIVGFPLPGELVGLTALHDEAYQVSAEALQTTAVCEVPFEELESVSTRVPALRRYLLRLLSRESQRSRNTRLLLATPRAEARVAMFIEQYLARLDGRGLSIRRFSLPMSRSQLANHLGLAVETVSRTLSTFRANGYIHVRGRELKITEPVKLSELANRNLSAGR